jgi:hypothetical protein
VHALRCVRVHLPPTKDVAAAASGGLISELMHSTAPELGLRLLMVLVDVALSPAKVVQQTNQHC